MTLSARARALTALFWRDWLEARATPWAGVSRALSLVLAVGSTHLVARAVLGAPRTDALPGGYFAWLLTGLLFADVAHALVSGAAERLRALQLQGGLEVDLQGPVRGATYLLGLSLFPLAAALTRAAVVLGVAAGGLGLTIVAASVTLVVQRADPVGRLVAAAAMLGSGIAYPREVLPGWALAVADALPTTPALDALRAGLLGGVLGERALFALSMGVVVGAPLSVWCAAHAEAWARRHGRLSAD